MDDGLRGLQQRWDPPLELAAEGREPRKLRVQAPEQPTGPPGPAPIVLRVVSPKELQPRTSDASLVRGVEPPNPLRGTDHRDRVFRPTPRHAAGEVFDNQPWGAPPCASVGTVKPRR